MQVAKKSQVQRFENSPECVALEYPIQDKDINAVVVEIDGRYPELGFAVNEVCKELVYVISGSGVLVVHDQQVTLEPEMSILLEPGERFYWEGKSLRLFMPCTPAWYPEQHTLIGL